jgi:hypothetical protein
MGKRWRRTASTSGSSSSAAPTAPLVLFASTGGASDLEVQFNQAVTWDGVGAGTFTSNGNTGTWVTQIAADRLGWNINSGGVTPGDVWAWSGADSSLTPVPDPSQTGIDL